MIKIKKFESYADQGHEEASMGERIHSQEKLEEAGAELKIAQQYISDVIKTQTIPDDKKEHLFEILTKLQAVIVELAHFDLGAIEHAGQTYQDLMSDVGPRGN